MGLGGATRKLQKVADMGEELYSRISELREQMLEVHETVKETDKRVATLENKVDGQTAIIEALADSEGIDVDELLTETAIEEAEPEGCDEVGDDAADSIPDAESRTDAS
ncbi:MAG: DUF5798 family protein [Natronomonas sp.]|jgi:hypothetical protein|uniref:DUF5798 family protein n=1 Tax=Natronomonas sp. TaxID=2184060 RepID=UPI0028701AA2|nr:DUF5798 family protein [Natronomonas sp.]MDR9380845.1 DUF5798 family protein [Natronomonas sp.]MDR9430882.1 DUF5798 family protein [Natronomonas sp.]